MLSPTDPVGVVAPVPALSATVTVQVDGEPRGTEAGEHVADVNVALAPTLWLPVTLSFWHVPMSPMLALT